MVSDVRRKPIPKMNKTSTALMYRDVPVDRTHALYDDPFVYLDEMNIACESYYFRKDGLNAPYYRHFKSADERPRSRKAVAEKLKLVNAFLKQYGVEVFVLDAYRPIPCQVELWEHFLKQAASVLVGPTDQKLREFAGMFCSDPSDYNPSDSTTWPAHSTGAAIDLTLRRLGTGEHLYMGGIFDDASEISFTRYYEDLIELEYTDKQCPETYIEARDNRRLLYWSMAVCDFANFSNEWWHFDWGNQFWVFNQEDIDVATAYYGTWLSQ